jgi:hypothetical protein
VVVFAEAAGALLLLAGRRAVSRRRMAVLADIPEVRRAGLPSEQAIGTGLIGGDGLRHFHRVSCQLAEGRNWPIASREQHEQDGRIACGVCRP